MDNFIKKTAHKSICENIKVLRNKHKWTQKYMAVRLGISTPAFSKIETGIIDINLSRLEQIAGVYEISVIDLLKMENGQVDPVTPSPLSILQNRLADRETEIKNLQRKIIELYEVLQNKKAVAV